MTSKSAKREAQMQLGPWLVIRGAAVMIILMVLFIRALISSTPVMASPAQTESAPSAAEAANPAGNTSENNADCHVSSKFPQSILQWCGYITQYAESAGLSPDFIAAVMLQESGGNPQAYSASGAVGLMQVMSSDGKAASFMCANGPCFASRPSIEELQDPEFNIQYGVRMLAGLYGRYQDLREALKAYGPMNMGYYYADKVMAIYNRYHE